MASSSIYTSNHNTPITSAPAPFALLSFGRPHTTSGDKPYPACRDDSTGPCKLRTSSSEACKKKFITLLIPFFEEQYCLCTNGYYARSLECAVDCYGYGRTSLDTESISRESSMVELDCKSYSLEIESQSAFYSDISSIRASIEQDRSTTTPASKIGGESTLGVAAPATTAILFPPARTDWEERPTASGQVKEGKGVPTTRGAKCNVLVLVTVVLAILTLFYI